MTELEIFPALTPLFAPAQRHRLIFEIDYDIMFETNCRQEEKTMFCFQCQETAKNTGCTVRGVCGKPEETADLQDLLIYLCKGISVYGELLKEKGTVDKDASRFICEALFTTITNVAWDDEVIIDRIVKALRVRNAVKEKLGATVPGALPDCATWASDDKDAIVAKAMSDEVRITAAQNEDVRSLRELLIIGSKGIAAYADHAAILGHEEDDVYGFLMEALASTTRDLSTDAMIGLVMKAGETAVNTMAMLDKANTTAYGNPEITEVNIGVGKNPGILISGHDLKDMEELLAQTEGTGVDVYTHGEMLPANCYPALKNTVTLSATTAGRGGARTTSSNPLTAPSSSAPTA